MIDMCECKRGDDGEGAPTLQSDLVVPQALAPRDERKSARSQVRRLPPSLVMMSLLCLEQPLQARPTTKSWYLSRHWAKASLVCADSRQVRDGWSWRRGVEGKWSWDCYDVYTVAPAWAARLRGG